MNIIESYNKNGQLSKSDDQIFARKVKVDSLETYYALFNSRNELADPQHNQFLPGGPLGKHYKLRSVSARCYNAYMHYLLTGQTSFFTQANRWR